MGINIGYPTPQMAPIPTPNPMGMGGLGGLGGTPAQKQPGFFQSDSFGNILTALGVSLMGSPRNNPLLGFGPTLLAGQKGIREDRQAQEERAAFEQVLVQSGMSPEEARRMSANPQAAKLRLDMMERQRDMEMQAQQRGQTYDFFAQNAPEYAAMIDAGLPVQTAWSEYVKSRGGGERQGLMNAGDGMIYDPNSGEWLTAPNRAARPPQVETFYDEATGQPYNAQWNAESGTWERVGGVKAPSGMSITTNPDGTVSVTQGSTGGGKMTEQNSKDMVYAKRAAGALPIIDKMGDALTSAGEAVGGSVPAVGNYLKSPEYQQAEQAGKEFLQAILRKDTGAAITAQEVNEYGTVYLPRPGDSQQVLAQKKESRRRALEALALGIPPDLILRLEQTGVEIPKGNDGSGWRDVGNGVRIRKK